MEGDGMAHWMTLLFVEAGWCHPLPCNVFVKGNRVRFSPCPCLPDCPKDGLVSQGPGACLLLQVLFLTAVWLGVR